MKIIAILVLVFGATLAGGAIYFASQYFDEFEARMQNQAPQGVKTVNIIVARERLPYGTVIVPNEHLRWVAWPEDALPEGAFTDREAFLGNENVPDRTRVVLRQIEAGEPILTNKVSGFGERKRMAMQLDEGMRAFAIRIDAISGVAGFISPGDRVDVLMTRASGAGLESTVILRNILVIAVDQDTNAEKNNPRIGQTATVQVSPTDAQKLALAQQVGRLSLTLRGIDVATPAEMASTPETVDVRDLLGIQEEAPRKERASTSVTVRKGGAVEGQIQFEANN